MHDDKSAVVLQYEPNNVSVGVVLLMASYRAVSLHKSCNKGLADQDLIMTETTIIKLRRFLSLRNLWSQLAEGESGFGDFRDLFKQSYLH